jgi:hypothetical protein
MIPQLDLLRMGILKAVEEREEMALSVVKEEMA